MSQYLIYEAVKLIVENNYCWTVTKASITSPLHSNLEERDVAEKVRFVMEVHVVLLRKDFDLSI